MAYQNVGTPRFYISVLQWLKSLGKIKVNPTITNSQEIGQNYNEILSLLDLNPSDSKFSVNFEPPDSNFEIVDYLLDSPIAKYMIKKNGFSMALNHNFYTKDAKYYFKETGFTDGHTGASFGNGSEEIVNFIPNGNKARVNYNGWSLGISDDVGDLSVESSLRIGVMRTDYTSGQDTTDMTSNFWDFNNEIGGEYAHLPIRVGCFAFGNYWDCPHSPDLNLTMTREYEGIKTIETKGGASLSNSFYRGSPKWGDAGAWELSKDTPAAPNQEFSRSGRRIWDLSFSYLSAKDTFGANQLMSQALYTKDGYVQGAWDGDEDWYDTEDPLTGWVFSNKIVADPSFFAQVIHKTNGGQLPFVFQPDNSNNNPDQFAICKLDMNSFKFEQVANGVYNVKLKIREVW